MKLKTYLPLIFMIWSCTPEATLLPVPAEKDQSLTTIDKFISEVPILDFDVNQKYDMNVLGQYGDSCQNPEDCESGYCIENDDGKICTKFCSISSDCLDPDVFGLGCGLLSNSGVDAIQLCIPARNDLCKPCESDLDCGEEVSNNLCLPIGRGNYCARSCDENRPCPRDYACQMLTVEGENIQQCMPVTNMCAGCMDMDGDGYGEGGDCAGIDCDESNININAGSFEICDNLDNDCDFSVDEELTSPQISVGLLGLVQQQCRFVSKVFGIAVMRFLWKMSIPKKLDVIL